DTVDHALVHVDVDHLGAVLDLLSSHRERGVVVVGLDEVAESCRPGDVGALADVDEKGVVVDGERLQAGQPHRRVDRGYLAPSLVLYRAGDLVDVIRGGPAASADDIDVSR